MHERLSLYVQRESFIHRLNPLTKLTLTFVIILTGFISPWYWTAQALIFAIVIPLSFVGKVQREYFWTALRLLVPAAGFIFFMQALFLPIGTLEIFRWWIFQPTFESLSLGFLTANRIFVMVSSFILFLLCTHPSEMMSDLTRRGLPGQFAYVIVTTLQIIPQMQAKAQTIIAAQRSRGLDTEGSYAKRMKALIPLVGPLVFGSLVEVEERAIAIEARGFSSKRKKTFLREIPDTTLDKLIRWALVALVSLAVVAKILGGPWGP
jgi:energy-coupling factor transport system permease protein